jgi:glycosyltransferase involved in cell wall biosynthesis
MAGVLVHEWIARSGGSENVLQAMGDVYPDADVVCLWDESTGRFDGREVRETWLGRSPLRGRKVLALPLMPSTWRHLPGGAYDFALISSHLFAHHARFASVPAERRFVYVHSPARYIWDPQLDARGSGRAARTAGALLKPLDRRRARETRHFATNSAFVRDRIARAWDVRAEVIHPPVDVERIQAPAAPPADPDRAVLDRLPDEFLLGASRFVPYKQLDQVIRAGVVTGLPVVLAGAGPEEAALRRLAAAAPVRVEFVISPSTPLLWELYRRCALYVFPPVEDFGIMPVEAMAAGAPVVANAVGGATESVVPGLTGAWCDFSSDAAVLAAVEQARGAARVDCAARARTFSARRFADAITGWVGAGVSGAVHGGAA